MAKKPTTSDAHLILELYDLRREAEMRKARNWFAGEFFPQSADDFVKIANAFPSQENAWMRQVAGYWDMAASLVLHGAVNEELFPSRLWWRNRFDLRQDPSFRKRSEEAGLT
jgi:hypothetical protein